MSKAMAYLVKHQWAMDKGQCPECKGMQPGAIPSRSPDGTTEHEGHKRGCELAEAIEEFNWPVIYRSAE
jgi:hypothetical protein